MFGDPLGGLFFGGETLDHFRLAVRPKNIDHPAKSGIFFRATKNGPVFRTSGKICACGAPDQASLAALSVAAMAAGGNPVSSLFLAWAVELVAAAQKANGRRP